MEQSVFEFVADILPGLVPDELGTENCADGQPRSSS